MLTAKEGGVSAGTVAGRPKRLNPSVSRLVATTRTLPAWLVIIFGYVVARVISFGILAVGFTLAPGAPAQSSGGHADFMNYLTSWDGLHYEGIADHGYPTRLPLDSHGDVKKNAWAFLPLYPVLARGLMVMTGATFPFAALLLSLTFGLLAAIALHRLLLPRLGATSARWGALLFCFGPMSYLFQVAYADSAFLFFMFCAAIAIARRRWIILIPFAVAACFTHPGGIALALAVGATSVVRMARRDGSFTRREKVAAAAATAIIAIAGVAWPVIAGIVTQDPSAYFDSETAWWAAYVGHTNFIPFSPWFLFADRYLGVAGIVVVLGVLGASIYWFTRPTARKLGGATVAYLGSYGAYLFAVFLPQQSLLRMLLPMSPLLGHRALVATRKRRITALAVSIGLQPCAVLLLWVTWPP
jgi:hypothetical protein